LPSIIGLLVGTSLLLATLNLWPDLQIPWLWQIGAVIALCAINLIYWKQERVSPRSISEALGDTFVGIVVLAIVFGIDLLVGFVFGAKSILEGLSWSGIGFVIDLFLLSGFLFLVIPTLAKSVCVYYFDNKQVLIVKDQNKDQEK
jgi:hypothetical protein